MIVNLQRPGEHPYCGPNTLDILSGYSYTPSLFSTEGINVKLCGWKDMDVPDSLYFMLDIVKEMIYEVKHEKKRVLVHCHAGKGRTGVVIACYLMFKYHIKSDEAVNKVREKRPKCIESKSQMEYCKKFFQFISGLREIFSKEKKDVYTFIKHQNDLILKTYPNQNNYDKERSFIPLMILITLNLLLKLKKKNICENIDIYKSLNGSCDLNDEIYANIQNITIEINKGNWKVLKKCKDPVLIGELLFIWMDDCINNCVNPTTVDEAIYQEIEINENEENVINDNNNNENNENINNNDKNNNKKEKIYNLLMDYKNIDNNIIAKIYDSFQNKFKKYEWEILKFFANFLKETLPDPNNKIDKNFGSSKTPTNKIENNNIINDILIIKENIKEEDENSHSNPDFLSQIKIEEEKQYQLMLEKMGIFILGYDIDLLYENQSMSIININNNNNSNINNNKNNNNNNNNNSNNNNNLSLTFLEKPNSCLNSVKNAILLLKFLRDTLNQENYGFYEAEYYYLKSPMNQNNHNLKTFKDFFDNYKNYHRASTLSNNSSYISSYTNNKNNPFNTNEVINNNNINNNVNNNFNNIHSHSFAHSNSSNFVFNLNKKNMSPNLSMIKEMEFNKDYEKKLFEVYKILKLHFEKNLSWSKIGYKNYENIYNNLDMSDLENNNFFSVSLFNNNKKNKNIKNLLTTYLNESSKSDFKIQVMSCEKEDNNNPENLKNTFNKNNKYFNNNYSFKNFNDINNDNNNDDININNNMNNNDENCKNNNDINNLIDSTNQNYKKNTHSKSNQIPKIKLNEKKLFNLENIDNNDVHVTFYCPKKKKFNILNNNNNNNNNNTLVFRNHKKRSTIILKNLFNTNIIPENKNFNSLLFNKKFKKYKSNQIENKKNSSNKILKTTSK